MSEPIRFGEPFPRPAQDKSAPASSPEDLRRIIRDSVSHHLVSDVPIALFLSGGLDSSSVVAAASEVSDTKLDTFTITFGEAEFSEAIPARAVAQRFGTRHHEIPLSGKNLLHSLPDTFAAMDQPSLDGLNTYAVSRAVRENGIKVVLSGLGGDELFGGYPSFGRAALAARVWKFRRLGREILRRASTVLSDSRLERIRALLDAPTPARGAYKASRTLFDDRQIRSLTSAGSTSHFPALVPDNADEILFTLLQQVSLLETTGYMRNTLLRDSDVFSMAHGLELRVPFVDRDVARVAMGFPDSQKLRRGTSKPILVEAMKDVLPPSLLSRPKQGFTLPFEKWMRQDLFKEMDATLTSANLNQVGLSASAVARIWSDFQHGKSPATWSRPWALYTLKRWAEQNEVCIAELSVTTAAAESFAATP